VSTGRNTSFPMQTRVIDGLQACAERALRELPTTGDSGRKRTVETAGELTPRQVQIARHAWDRRANPEIGTQPFIGTQPDGWRRHTVEPSKTSDLRNFGNVYPGRPEQVHSVRADLRGFLNGCPIADETILVASELAANAATHSSSRQPGGRFIVRAEVRPGDYAWVEVEDQGGTWAGHHPGDGRPHGLDIVQAIAGDRSWGIGGDATLGRVAWARLGWPGR
jgi:anti-sigma regulatory factor (Ser/Thr protein kinase)